MTSYAIQFRLLSGGCGQESIKFKIVSEPGREIDYDVLVIPELSSPRRRTNVDPTGCLVNGARLY